jgi:DNA-binding XRE family transcriptional regulator
MTDTDADAYESPTLPRYRSWAEREAAQRATRDAERDELAQRIQASRASQNRHEREGSQRRQLADIQVFRALMLDVLEHPLAKTKSPRSGSFASFKSVCSLIKQRCSEDPSFLSPGLSQSLPFFYKMVSTPAAWIAIADRLADHTRAGLTREMTALGPFTGLRVSIRSILVNTGIHNVIQLRAAITARSIVLDHDISSNGLTRRRWTELLEWIDRQA